MNYQHLLEPMYLGGLRLRNRMVTSVSPSSTGLEPKVASD